MLHVTHVMTIIRQCGHILPYFLTYIFEKIMTYDHCKRFEPLLCVVFHGLCGPRSQDEGTPLYWATTGTKMQVNLLPSQMYLSFGQQSNYYLLYLLVVKIVCGNCVQYGFTKNEFSKFLDSREHCTTHILEDIHQIHQFSKSHIFIFGFDSKAWTDFFTP